MTLGRFLGKTPVLLVFWATWCPECKAAIPEINALTTGPLAEKLQIFGIDFRESREKVAQAVKSRGIRYPVLLDERGQAARAYGVVGIPTYVLIDREGKVALPGARPPRRHLPLPVTPGNPLLLLRRRFAGGMLPAGSGTGRTGLTFRRIPFASFMRAFSCATRSSKSRLSWIPSSTLRITRGVMKISSSSRLTLSVREPKSHPMSGIL